VRIGHVGINVSDLDRSRRWYVDELGARPAGAPHAMEDGTRVAFLELPAYAIEMVQPAAPLPARGAPSSIATGFHVGIDVDDAPGATRFVAGPDGEVFEFGGGHHVGCNVSSVVRFAQWVQTYFGATARRVAPAEGDLASAMGMPAGARADVAIVPLGPAYLEALTWVPPPASTGSPSFRRIGGWHLCLDVGDPATIEAAMNAAGEEIVLPLQSLGAAGRPSFFARGPDGILVQVRAPQ
jgi:catechol 2,3-dioxygenase-like lactoylglutathione lyase family enzyme